jgi:uncharacterized glyoxalase superfamily protein PhnB
MFSSAKNTRATVIPCLRYSDAPAAIEWLCRAFGFEKHLVVPGDKGTIAHAQLSFGNGMIMLGSALDTEFGRLMKQPNQVGGAETQCPYVVVADADAHYARAKAAGALIVMISRTKTTVAGAIRAAISKAISGTSAPMILGPAIEAAPAIDPAVNSTPYP